MREDGLNRGVEVVARQVGDKLVLKSISLAATEDGPHQFSHPELYQAPDGDLRLGGIAHQIDPGTEFTLNWLPLGGFVRPRGENNPDVPDGLSAANPWKRLGVLVAGPVMNILTAIVVFSAIVAQMGIAVPGKVLIEDVTADSPAEQAGLQGQDIIRAINGTAVSEIDAARSIIRGNLDKPIDLAIERNGQQLVISATPLSSRTAEQGALGISLSYPRRPAGLGEALVSGATLTGVQAVGILYMPVALVQGVIAPKDARLVGLKGIYDFLGTAVERDTQSRQQASETSGSGQAVPKTQSYYVLSLIGMLSVSLGVFNLLPIPALDGGRILFTLPEILIRRRIPHKFENMVNGVAMLVLIGLMLVVNLMDFINPVNVNLP